MSEVDHNQHGSTTKPTIAEFEALMNDENLSIEILPNGEVRVRPHEDEKNRLYSRMLDAVEMQDGRLNEPFTHPQEGRPPPAFERLSAEERMVALYNVLTQIEVEVEELGMQMGTMLEQLRELTLSR